MKFKINCILLMFCLFLTLNLCAEAKPGKQELFQTAINAYQNKEYDTALKYFEELNDKINSAGLFYNIGNCHIKMGNIGLGISAYYSALQRDNSNPDIKHNLSYANSLVLDNIMHEIKGIKDFIESIINGFSLRTHQILFLSLYFIFILTIISVKIIRKTLYQNKVLITVLTAVIMLQGAVLSVRYINSKKISGVIVSKNVKVRYGPSFSETEAFTINEGIKCDIFNQNGNWSLIRLGDGKIGWVPSDSYTIIK